MNLVLKEIRYNKLLGLLVLVPLVFAARELDPEALALTLYLLPPPTSLKGMSVQTLTTTQLTMAMKEPSQSAKRVLDPADRVSEVVFGLIMVLTFTGSLSIAEAGRDDIRTMLIGALGCNLAWGIIDAVLFLMGRAAEKGRNLIVLRAVRRASDPQEAQLLIADALPPVVASILESTELEAIQLRLKQLPEPPARVRLGKDDWLGGVGVFLLVVLSMLPVVIPFIFMQKAVPALRVSNAVAIAMLFVAGYAYGQFVGRRPSVLGIALVLLGSLLVALTKALGG